MGDVFDLLERANKALRVADHLAYVTYPLIKDTKLVMTILENINNALRLSTEAVVEYDRVFKRISEKPEDFPSLFETFKMSSVPRYNIEREHVALIGEVAGIMEQRKKSPIEFVRRDKIVICTDKFRTKTVDYDRIKDYLNKSKKLMLKINHVVGQNARRF